MINKNLKRIFNRYSNIFKFLFYLKYLFLIFFITTLVFLLIPKFYNYEDKQIFIKEHLLQNYNLNIKDIKKIQYNILPLPNIELNNVALELSKKNYEINSKKIILFLNILNINNFKNFKTTKVNFIESFINIKIPDIPILYKLFINHKNKLNFKDLIIKISSNDKFIIDIKKINFSNYGYKKNKLRGEIFKRKFKINITEDLNKISFKLLKTGIFGEIVFLSTSNSPKMGKFKAQILNSNIKFDFSFDGKTYIVENYFFRNKNLSYESSGKITLDPFLNINLKSIIKEINRDLFKKINIENLLENKDLLKRLNLNQEIDFISKRFSRSLIKMLNINLNIAYGRLVSKKIIYFDEGEILCNSEINLLEDSPILIFNCLIETEDKKKFLKNFLYDYKKKDESLNLKINGNLNLKQKKINFLNIQLNNSYKSKEEDLKFFKKSFESILLDKNFLDIFNIKKISKFIKEVS